MSSIILEIISTHLHTRAFDIGARVAYPLSMYVTYVIYAIFVALLFWGGKFAGFKDKQMHGDTISLDAMKSLRGFAAIGIIIHHISQQDAFQYASQYGQQNELSFFLNYGFKLVAIFFFCSGYGLVRSINSKYHYLNGFMKRRVLKTIVIPFYVSVVIYAVWHIICGDEIAPLQWVTNVIGLTMMNEYAWYPIVLTILYITFYFVFENLEDKKTRYIFILVIILFQGVYFCLNGHFAWWAAFRGWWTLPSAFDNVTWWMQQRVWLFSGEWWVNSQIAFLVGIYVAENEDALRDWFSYSYWAKLIGLVAVGIVTNFVANFTQSSFSYWSEFAGSNPGIKNKLICYIFQLPQVASYVLIIYMILMKYNAQNPVSRFFGSISFETYMMNLIALEAFSFLITDSETGLPLYKAGHWNLGLYAACVFAGTILLAFGYKWINKQVNKLIG